MNHRLFRFCSRLFVSIYGRWPVFGEIRSSIAIIRRGDECLLQRRGDGLGWAFPGGCSWWWEDAEQTLRREVREETGLEVAAPRLLFVFHDRHYIPAMVSVFAAEADGEPRGSWEGDACWTSLAAARAGFFPAQQAVLDYLDGQKPPG